MKCKKCKIELFGTDIVEEIYSYGYFTEDGKGRYLPDKVIYRCPKCFKAIIKETNYT